MSLDDGTKNVMINGQEVTYYSTTAVKQHEVLVKGYYWDKEKEHWIKVNPNWYVYTREWNGEAWRKIAGIKVIDFATPQEWFDKNLKEIRNRGGAAWWYDRNPGWGEPLFFDQLQAMAMKNIKKHVPSAPATRKPVKRGKR